jgi:hypothetical protein
MAPVYAIRAAVESRCAISGPRALLISPGRPAYSNHGRTIHAYLELISLNMRAWRPEVAAWIHSEDSADALGKLLAIVPCSPSIH